jgi:hypothetical protein
MKTKRIFSLLLAAIMLSFVVACSEKDDTQPEQPQQQDAPQLSTQIVEPPDAMVQSDDPGAQMAVSYISMANAFSGWAGMMTPPPQKSAIYKSTNDDPWTYTWDFNEGQDIYSITLTIYETTTHYEWTMVINGILDGIVLDDFLYMSATESLDGEEGSYYLYDPEIEGPAMKVEWFTNGNGVYSLAFEAPDDMIIEMSSNMDGSGEIVVYDWNGSEYLMSFRAIWDASGHGEYWEYYEGELEDHGEW